MIVRFLPILPVPKFIGATLDMGWWPAIASQGREIALFTGAGRERVEVGLLPLPEDRSLYLESQCC